MEEYLRFDLICEKCNKNFTWEVKKRNYNKKDIRKCCSRKCANSRIQTSEMNLSRSLKLKGIKGKSSPNKGKQIKDRIIVKCNNLKCNNTFSKLPSYNRKYCNSCSKLYVGGYREGSGRSKHGYYNGIYCGSTYELVWVIYNLDHNIKFSRFEKMLEHSGLKYIPDFIIEDKIYEIKGYCDIDKVNKKCEVAIKHGYEVEVLFKKDIQYMFDYVSEKYNTTKYYELYDKYSPKFNYICGTCGKEFGRNKKSKLLINYCSRVCSSNRPRINDNKKLLDTNSNF